MKMERSQQRTQKIHYRQADSFAKDVEELQQRLLNQSYVKFDIPTMAAIYRKLL